jgi:hypothetical protein
VILCSASSLTSRSNLVQITLAYSTILVFNERKIAQESPMNALINDHWITQVATELCRVFLDLEMKLVRQHPLYLDHAFD